MRQSNEEDKLIAHFKNKKGEIEIREFHIPIRNKVKFYIQYRAIESSEWTLIRAIYEIALFTEKEAYIKFKKMYKSLERQNFTIKPWERKHLCTG